MRKTVTVRTLMQMKKSGEKIAMMTAYDYPTARLLADAGMHMLLVGDSVGMVVQGHDTTLSVTLDEMVYHTKMVVRGVMASEAEVRPMVVADLPFMTYQVSVEDAVRNAGRLLGEAGAHAVKLEGGASLAPTVSRLVEAGIPVVAHIGLTPQSVNALGGFRVQGRTEATARQLLEDAAALQDAGAYAIVLEMVPAELAEAVTSRLSIPTIGIGAGPDCDGQVLVFHDFIGYTSGYIPKHNKRYADLAQMVIGAAKAYVEDVATGRFPGDEQTVRLKPEEQNRLSALLKGDVMT
jgi:3-methyl-2-oxobutanoate hydroxymethyltransferase